MCRKILILRAKFCFVSLQNNIPFRKEKLKKFKETRFGARSVYNLNVSTRLKICYLDPVSKIDLTFWAIHVPKDSALGVTNIW